MAMYKTYPTILQGWNSKERAISHGQFLCFEEEATEQEIAHADRIGEVGEIGVYYCYGSDHYFYTDESTEEE